MRKILAAVYIAVYFLKFTWPGPLLYYSGDDMMNLYNYWTTPLSKLVLANFEFWSSYYRPFGAIVYLPLYYAAGFQPRPLYILYYAALLLNIYLTYAVVRRITRSEQVAALAALVWCFHGKLDYLYFNAGSLYDVFCLLWLFVALILYLGARVRGEIPGPWRLAGFVVSFVCALNSKEMAATLPAILLLYELFAHGIPRLRIPELARWTVREGRGVLISGLMVLAYVPGKFAAGGLSVQPAYKPAFTVARFLENMQYFWAEIFYRSGPYTDATPMGITPLSVTTVLLIYAVLIAVLLAVRSRWVLFGLLFFQIALLPVSFTPPRLGFVLYLPLVGLAIYIAALLVWGKDRLSATVPAIARFGDSRAMTGLFIVTAALLLIVHGANRAPNPSANSPYRITVRDVFAKHRNIPHGARILFVKSALAENYDLVFMAKLFYRDNDLFVTQLNGPREQRVPIEKLEPYDYVFSYEDGRWLEYDNTDIPRSLRLHLLKGQRESGESFAMSDPDRGTYIVSGVLLGNAPSADAWTLDNPEFRFRLKDDKPRSLVARFTVVGETLRQTGPLKVEYSVNGHLLSREVYDSAGDRTYRHAVPDGWLKPGEPAMVRIHFVNPYIAPADKARLGVLLKGVGFEPGN